jgi:hypothetical protein
MRVLLREDIIIKVLDTNSPLGVEVGDPPMGSPIDFTRLRYNGSALVDLFNEDEMYVRREPSKEWTLHCVEVPGSQLVTMKFNQKKWLIDDAGTYRVMTVEEIEAYKTAQKADQLENRELRASAKQLVQSLTYSDINTHIDTVFGALTTAQKNSLKKLYKAVLFLAKDRVRKRS